MADVYQLITDRIVQQLEAGIVPWRRPWQGGGMPTSLSTGKHYRGVNVFLLSCAPYASRYWASYRQIQELGGHVRKGEKATIVVFWKLWEKESDDPDNPDNIPVLRYYNVFNAEQTEGIDPSKLPDDQPERHEWQPIEQASAVAEAMPQRPAIRHEGSSAFYRRSDDSVTVPEISLFDSPEAYHATMFHELVHSTGHQSRLNRTGITEQAAFGSDAYGREELVAEMGAAFLCGHCGFFPQTEQNAAAYIGSWLRAIRQDKRLVVVAAAQAQKAADFILNRKWEEA